MRTVRDKNNLMIHEFIGLEVRVVQSKCFEYVGLKGKVLDETKNVLVLNTPNGVKKLPKDACIFRFLIGQEKVDINGSEICYRPENRIKKLLRKVKRRKV